MESEVVPTFYLGSQPYEFEPEHRDSLRPFAVKALDDTQKQYFRLLLAYAGFIDLPEEDVQPTRGEILRRMLELGLGNEKLCSLGAKLNGVFIHAAGIQH